MIQKFLQHIIARNKISESLVVIQDVELLLEIV